MSSAAVAERSAAVAGVPLMTEQEARACVAKIKAATEDIAALLADLRERDGHLALGYKTWQECIRHEFHMSRVQAHRLINAHQVERALALPIGNVEHLPESHARELVPLLPEPETLRVAATKVIEEKGEQATAADYRAAVDEHLARPPKEAATAPRSISSRAERSDFADDAPDYAEQSQDTRPAGPAERFCSDCGGKYLGERCPCTQQATPSDDDYPCVSEQPCTQCGGEIVVLSEQDDRARAKAINEAHAEGRPVVQLCESCQLGDDAPIADRPGVVSEAVEAESPVSATAAEALVPPSAPAPPATQHASQQPDAPLSDERSTGKAAVSSKSGGTHSRLFAAPTLSAGDLTRALLDLPISRVVEAITENATPTQIAAIREAVGGSIAAAAPEAPAPETVTAGPRTIVEFETAAVEALTPGQIAGLIGRLMKHLDARGLAGIEPFLADLKAKASA